MNRLSAVLLLGGAFAFLAFSQAVVPRGNAAIVSVAFKRPPVLECRSPELS